MSSSDREMHADFSRLRRERRSNLIQKCTYYGLDRKE